MIGARTFLGIPEEYSRLERARFVVLPVPWERPNPHTTGTRYGPSALIAASHHVEWFDEELGFEPWKAGIHTLPPPAMKDDPEDLAKSLADVVEPHLRAGRLPVTVGGDHAITDGPLSAVRRVHPKVSVFHIEAHCDLRDGSEGDGTSHAFAAKRMAAVAEKVVQVGVRSVSGEARGNAKRVRTFLARKHRDVEGLIPRVLEELGETVYLSVGLDGLDPSVVPGVAAPVPGGLGWWETLDLLRAVIRGKNVVAADVVDLCPLAGTGISELAAARLVYRMMGYVVHREAQKDTVRRTVKSKEKK
ncbi:MAG: arginase family protein [Planctomycetes bacterium]|nr:arginase family protein [Planctomycetota bacterium]